MTESPLAEPPAAPALQPWHDQALSAASRAELLLEAMTLREKLAQLGSSWSGAPLDSGSDVGPMQQVFSAGRLPFDQLITDGLGHLTRPFGSVPVEPSAGMAQLAQKQQQLRENTRLGIPAIVHEECLTGLTALGATVYPAPIAWAAAFDPDLVEEMARAIARDMRMLGIHQGLAPVLDVVRDYRWGRVEETLGEDPYLVGVNATAYVRGLEREGLVATLKHFAGYSASRAARNHAPVSMGLRELRDVILPPFEMAIRDGGARSVMNSYADVDGLPAAADARLLTQILREEWGFEGVVVSDYWSVAFLHLVHQVAGDYREAGEVALSAGIDIELPDALCFGPQLVGSVESGSLPEPTADRAVRRVLRQKAELGLLDHDWTPSTGELNMDLDSPANRRLARRLAERSVILLANTGLLPLSASDLAGRTVALIGPCANDPLTFMGCYSYPNHVLGDYPELGMGIHSPSLLDALKAEWPDTHIDFHQGVPISEPNATGITDAVASARAADVCIVAVGDRAGMFGRGTSGEGCDVPDLDLPGIQSQLLREVLDVGTPTVLVVVSGRPYALGDAGAARAMVQAFMPGEEGGSAIARVLAGDVNPSGKLPVQIPRISGGQPGTYLQPQLGTFSKGISNLDPTPLFAFGHGLSYTSFAYGPLSVDLPEIAPDGSVQVSVEVSNIGDRAGDEIVQLYLRDLQATTARPLKQLIGFQRLSLTPAQSVTVTFEVHADLFAYTNRDFRRVVEPGTIELLVGGSSAELPARALVEISGSVREVGHDRRLRPRVVVSGGQ